MKTLAFRTFLEEKIASLPATDLSDKLDSKACVAAILRGHSIEDLEVGFIRRAISPMDKWSGQIAFPGGRKEEADEDDFATTAREVREEIGMTLTRHDLLGHLHDVQARKAGGLMNFFIRPLVFYIDREEPLLLDPAEVDEFFWIRLSHLRDDQFKTTVEGFPAIQLHRDPPLWGLTYLMTTDLLGRLI